MKKLIRNIMYVMLILMLCLMNTMPVFAISKEETNFYKLDNSGKMYKNLSKDAEDQKENLPIDVEIEYYLNDEKISSKDIKGKSGNIKIKINCTNKSENKVVVDGKQTIMYTPYIVACGMILENSNFTDIKVSSGKAIDNGTDTLVLGIALPGMQESLDISEDDIEIPNNITIEAKVEKFELGNIYLYVESNMFNSDNFDFLDEFNSIYNDMQILKDASTQLVKGTEELKEGTLEYAEKMNEFNEGLTKYTTGVTTVSSSYLKINEGISSINKNSKKIAEGSKGISTGITNLKSSLTTLMSSMKEIKEGTDGIYDGTGKIIDSVDNSITTISTSTSENSETYKKLETLGTATETTIYKLGVTVQKLEQILSTIDDTEEEKTQLLATIDSINDQINELKTNVRTERTAYNKTIEEETTQVVSGLNDLKVALKSLQGVSSQVKNGIDRIVNNSASLNSGLTDLETGAKDLSTGTSAVYNGANELASGSTILKNGLDTLNSSTGTIQNASIQLETGANTIAEGANTLKEGMEQFDNDGINKLYNLVNGDIKNIQTRVNKLLDLASKENNETSYRYILKVDNLK